MERAKSGVIQCRRQAYWDLPWKSSQTAGCNLLRKRLIETNKRISSWIKMVPIRFRRPTFPDQVIIDAVTTVVDFLILSCCCSWFKWFLNLPSPKMAMHLSCSWLRHILTTCSLKKYPYFQFIIFLFPLWRKRLKILLPRPSLKPVRLFLKYDYFAKEQRLINFINIIHIQRCVCIKIFNYLNKCKNRVK